ncbi:hypothetical protein QTO34_000357 [Cnephaeus nilssonii]|uniref:DNA helicase Pif1-like 2B domain-containing protein n=1 Tax=Cnephaeus nilssonii TaxID=3371016 RepID=A0AA40LUB1_CNENI|nr:hypothetical protein QTO34_000357 [Eptesicus nilssonii]
MILLRNLNSKLGLCNGTRFIIKRLRPNIIKAEVLTGSAEGEVVLIPRIDFSPSDTGLPFKLIQRQIPVMPAFAMTINKSQGQTLDRVGIFLREPVFAHGSYHSKAGSRQAGGAAGGGDQGSSPCLHPQPVLELLLAPAAGTQHQSRLLSAISSKFFLRDEEALLKEIRFSRKMSDKTGKVVHLKQAKEEKPRNRAAAPLSQHRSRGHGLVGAAATAVAAAADSAQRLSVKEETIFLRDGPTRVTDPTELPTEILGAPETANTDLEDS